MSSTSCFHCGLPVTDVLGESAEIQGQTRDFCCHGCRSVCEAIHAAGLEGFYRRTPEGELLAPPPELPKELKLFDLDEVQEEFVDGLGDHREINLLVEGIHCAACVWLIEQGLAATPGVEQARVNLTGRRLRLKWDNSRASLSSILTRLGQLGYSAVPFDPEAAEGAIHRENRKLLYRMAFAAFGMMNLMWISIALYTGADQGEFRDLFHWIGFLIATPTLIYSGWPFYRNSVKGLVQRNLSMDLPIAIGASITYAYSLYVTITGVGHVYWDTVVNFIFVILVGRYLEAISRRQAVSSTQRLLDLQPKVATLLKDGEEAIVPIRAVGEGDRVLVRPGETIPVDGEILEGRSSIDESMLSGESAPVTRGPGEQVSAGTLNGAGVLQLRVSGVLRDSALGRIIRLVEDAQASKPPIQCTTDRLVPWFVAITLTLGTLTFLFWVRQDFEIALMAATSVLIITCPCALGLATPMAIAVASGLGARHGILIKNSVALEDLSRIQHYVFDKTGTLTMGRPRVDRIRYLAPDISGVEHSGSPDIQRSQEHWVPGQGVDALSPGIRAALTDLAALERLSEHPLARAITNLARDAGMADGRASVSEVVVEPGAGISGLVDGRRVVIGTIDWLGRQGVSPQFEVASGSFSGSLKAASTTVSESVAKSVEPSDLDDGTELGSQVHAAVDGQHCLSLWIQDRLREDAASVVARLKEAGLRVTMLTGDQRQAAERIAQELGGVEVIAEVLPEDKDRVVAELQRNGQRVAMIGDGINDAPALVRADVGIAIGSGTDVSIASADIVLMSTELSRVHDAGLLARRTLRTIRQNIGLSFTYNIIMVPLAMAAMITPLIAAVSMPLSSLAVIGNSARIRRLFRRRTGRS